MAIRDESRMQRPEHTFIFRYVHFLPCFSLRNSSRLRIIHIFLCTRVQLSYIISQNFPQFVTYHTEICMYVCMCVYIYIYIYIYVYISRGRHIAYVQGKETLTKST
jgi:hypothetical protein